MKLLAQL